MGAMQDQDWYAYLRLSPQATTEEVEQAVERLSRQAAALAATAPERSQSLRETIRSIKRDLLSGPEDRQRYDKSRATTGSQPPPSQAIPGQPPSAQPVPGPAAPGQGIPGQPAPGQGISGQPFSGQPVPAQSVPGQSASGQSLTAPVPPPPPAAAPPYAGASPIPGPPVGPTIGSRLARFLRTGWTCPACGKDAVPSDKFCTKCGSPIRLVQPDTTVRAKPRRVCASCAAPLGTEAAFCSRCGTRADQ